MRDTRNGPASCAAVREQREADCQQCGLRASALFARLRPPEIEEAVARAEQRLLKRGHMVYRAGDPAEALFTVRVGVVKLVLEVPEAGTRIVRLLGRGATLGLESLGSNAYSHTAVALRTTSLCRLPRPLIDDLHRHNPALLRDVAAKWNEQMILADRWIAILGAGPVKRRVIDLVRLIAQISGDPPEAVKLPSTDDLASILGIAGESVSRHMAELKREGLLRWVAPHTYHCDPGLFESQQPRWAARVSPEAAPPPVVKPAAPRGRRPATKPLNG